MEPEDLTEVCLDCWHSDCDCGQCMKLNLPLEEAVKECEYLKGEGVKDNR